MSRVKVENGKINLVNQGNLRDVDQEAILVRSQSSVEVKRDAKGACSFTIKVYNDDPLVAVDKVIELASKLHAAYGVQS